MKLNEIKRFQVLAGIIKEHSERGNWHYFPVFEPETGEEAQAGMLVSNDYDPGDRDTPPYGGLYYEDTEGPDWVTPEMYDKELEKLENEEPDYGGPDEPDFDSYRDEESDEKNWGGMGGPNIWENDMKYHIKDQAGSDELPRDMNGDSFELGEPNDGDLTDEEYEEYFGPM